MTRPDDGINLANRTMPTFCIVVALLYHSGVLRKL